MIKIGTSGYSYADWKGTFYPPRIKNSDMLEYYSTKFDCVELNFTYYRIPEKKHLDKMVKITGKNVEFSVKAYQGITHNRSSDKETIQKFISSLSPLIDAQVLGAILFQFPNSFRFNQDNLNYISFLKEELNSLPMVIEFRHRSWIIDQLFVQLKNLNIGYCCVDEPELPGLMPPRAEVTSSLGYVRLHGRNAEKWWKHEHSWERYHYLYSKKELQEWVLPIKKMERNSEKVYLFANNHYNGNAATNAHMMKDLLGIKKSKTSNSSFEQLILNFDNSQ